MAHILVIDDEVQIRMVLEGALKATGHQVTMAADGAEGILKYRSAHADLVIIDLYMPKQDGLQTIAQLRKEFPAAPIIAMSGSDPAGGVMAVAKHLGVSAILGKPFTFDELYDAVGKAL